MGNTKKKKKARNVITTKTFAKKKIKVGKTLKKTNVTNTEFNAKSLVILEQFHDQTSEPVSQRGLTIRDLNRQIGHPSLPIRRDAVIGLKQLLKDHPRLIDANLYDLISSVGRLFCDEVSRIYFMISNL
jgi:pre-rRNA-processing protein IPI1